MEDTASLKMSPEAFEFEVVSLQWQLFLDELAVLCDEILFDDFIRC